jgi:hypothetical protein
MNDLDDDPEQLSSLLSSAARLEGTVSLGEQLVVTGFIP